MVTREDRRRRRPGHPVEAGAHRLPAVLGVTTTLFFSTLGGTAALAPLPALGFVLQIAALFGAFGAVLVLRAELRGWEIDRARTTSAWSSLGVTIGLVAVLADAL